MSATLRMVPPALVGLRRPQRLIERNALVYRRTWMIVVSGFFEPLFYLLSIRIGLGALVGEVTVGGQTVEYVEFVAPALLAASAMNGAIFDSTMNVFYKLKYARTYDAVLATPLGTGDVAVGEIGWALIRGLLYSVAFLVVMAVLGLIGSPWAVLALPACVLIGFAFASAGMAATSHMRTWVDFAWIEAVQIPLFLFSATFAPLTTYPPVLQWVVRITPLYHGVVLCRSLVTGVVGWDLLVHVVYLLAFGLVGLWIAARRLDRLLLT